VIHTEGHSDSFHSAFLLFLRLEHQIIAGVSLNGRGESQVQVMVDPSRDGNGTLSPVREACNMCLRELYRIQSVHLLLIVAPVF
jgi:hypothetical protein